MGKNSSESGKLASGGDDSVTMDFGLSAQQLSDEAKQAWQYDFDLIYSVTLGKDGLQTMLRIHNKGKESFEFQTLLHTYFKIDVRTASKACNVWIIGADKDDLGHLQGSNQWPRQH